MEEYNESSKVQSYTTTVHVAIVFSTPAASLLALKLKMLLNNPAKNIYTRQNLLK